MATKSVRTISGVQFLLLLVVFIFPQLAYSVSQNNSKPLIYIVATGGTIAGVASSQTSSTYKAGTLTAKDLIASIPDVKNIANIEYIQLYNKDSGDVVVSDWLLLNKTVNKLLSDPKVAGVVITHGTDTLEETAYFLDLTVKSKKPVVVVGSMRAATAVSADGPLNLYNAIAVAANKKSVNRGVLVAMNDEIFGARDVTKTNTTSVQTFQAPNSGKVGSVYMGDVNYRSKSEKQNTVFTPFNETNATSLPKVLIIYQYVGVDNDMLTNILRDKTIKGIVIAGVGDGNIPSYEDGFLKQAKAQGIVIVRASRVPSGMNTYNYNNLDEKYGTIAANDLNPQKARILLMLGLTKTSDTKVLSKYFAEY